MARLVSGAWGDDVVEIEVSAAGPLDLVFSKHKNKFTGLATCVVSGFKRGMDRSKAAVAMQALDTHDGMKDMLLCSINGEDFVHGQTHESEDMEAKDIPKLLTGPLTFKLERKAHSFSVRTSEGGWWTSVLNLKEVAGHLCYI